MTRPDDRTEVVHLDLEDLLRMIEMERIGPVRDIGLLDSAAHRPRTTVFGADAYPSLELKAAALLESLVRNRPLVDGNKRLGWLGVVAFFWVNDRLVLAPEDDAYDLVIGVAEGRVPLDRSAATLASWVGPRV